MSYESLVEFLKDEAQIAALSFMAVIYALKIWGIMKKNPIQDRTPNHGNPKEGVRYSFTVIAMPWEMQVYRDHPMKYIEFTIFHLAIAAAIASTFIIPYWPDVMLKSWIMLPSLLFIAAGFLCGLLRLIARLTSPAMRAFSVPDDYFSIILLNVYLISAMIAIPNSAATATDPMIWSIVLFFGLTAFFLIYVPFSKISHYLLWPFNRYYLGKHFGKRGVYPKNSAGLRAADL
ncbi:MAG: hypothetical protein AB1656_15035 [Candidatus Omnitrophota bacterium]